MIQQLFSHVDSNFFYDRSRKTFQNARCLGRISCCFHRFRFLMKKAAKANIIYDHPLELSCRQREREGEKDRKIRFRLLKIDSKQKAKKLSSLLFAKAKEKRLKKFQEEKKPRQISSSSLLYCCWTLKHDLERDELALVLVKALVKLQVLFMSFISIRAAKR